MKTLYKRFIGTAAVAAVLVTAISLPVFAETGTETKTANQNPPSWQGRVPGMMGSKLGAGMMQPGIFGTVTSVNGASLVVGGRAWNVAASVGNDDRTFPKMAVNTATTTYSVDATNATVYKNNATSTLSSIAVGDRVFIQGTISGTNVTATSIRDGVMMRGRGSGAPGNVSTTGYMKNGVKQTTLPKGNGQPVVAGTVSSLNGTTVMITTSSNTNYTIDVSSTTVNRNGTSSTVSSIAVGDYIVVQGTVNGSSVTASSVIDSQRPPTDQSGSSVGMPSSIGRDNMGFFGSIGGFFKRLFGF